MNLSHHFQYMDKQLQTYIYSEFSSSRCHQVIYLQIWKYSGSVNNP